MIEMIMGVPVTNFQNMGPYVNNDYSENMFRGFTVVLEMHVFYFESDKL